MWQAWTVAPRAWTLPVAGALVGYITNWLAIKLLFEPAEPVAVGPVVLQGLFEARQVEVSEEFATFLAERVLTSPRLLDELANGTSPAPRTRRCTQMPVRSAHATEGRRCAVRVCCTGTHRANFEALLRRVVPFVVPDAVVTAASGGVRDLAKASAEHEAHAYIAGALRIEPTLCRRLQQMSCTDFENLLHPVFKEDEIVLIVVGGILGAAAGLVQLRFGWGGPSAVAKLHRSRS